MGGRAMKQDPLMGYNFALEIDGFKRIGWTEFNGMKSTNAKVTYREGGDNHTLRKSPGLTEHSDLTLVRGQIVNDEGIGGEDLWNWWTQHYSIKTLGNRDFDFRRGVRLVQSFDDGTLARAWNFVNVFIIDFTPISDLKAADSEHSYESIVLTHEGFTMDGGVAPSAPGGSISSLIGL